jgi:predicted nucleotide-binding protein (sugar kinase/HSP70/actin superfamily)
VPKRIGIPKALLYYYYFPLWNAFFKGLGLEVVVSSSTNKAIVDKGVKHCVDEACLPVKLFFGHVLDIKDMVDYIFVPRIVSVEQKSYICPKFLGLPDMIRYNVPDLPLMIDVTIDMSRKNGNMYKAFAEVGKIFSRNPWKIKAAYAFGMKEMKRFEQMNRAGYLPHESLEEMGKDMIMRNRSEKMGDNLTIALIGHGYNIYDSYISMNIIEKLRAMEARVVTADNLEGLIIEECAAELPKRLFWTLGRKMIGSAFHFMRKPEIDGIIHVSSFGCGPDSFTGEIIERYIRREKTMPYLNLTIDEHTGEAGVITRLEAFIDMIQWRRAAQ